MTATSTDFVFPPTDGSVPPALAIDFHLKYNPNHIFSVLYDVSSSSQTNITYDMLAPAVYRAAHILNPNGQHPQGTKIGFLLSTDTIQYIIMILGAMRAGLVPFPISPRTHVAGIAHLLASTETPVVVSGGSQSINEITTQLTDKLGEMGYAVQIIGVPSLESILPGTNKSTVQLEQISPPILKPMPNEAIVNILHSSGSTGTPRPVKFHLEGVLKNLINQCHEFGRIRAHEGVRFGTMALPTFHTMGMYLQVIVPLYVGYTQVLFAPSHIPVVPTSNLTLEAAANAKCAHMLCAPAFLEAWSQDEGALAHLRQMKSILFGGGPLADAIGNKLVDRGISVHCCYGATEVVHVHEVWNSNGRSASDWGYVKFSSHVDTRFIPQNDAERTFELVFVESDTHKPFVINSEIDGRPAYKTKDLVVRHPSKPDFWKVFGRLDDQIVLHNGEKVNPGPMVQDSDAILYGRAEEEIAMCPIIQHAVMFGRERNQTGILVELKEGVSRSCNTKEARVKTIDEIWPFIERANRISPTYSRLEKRAIILVDPARSLPRTPKGTIPRSAALNLYASDIDKMYLDLEKHSVAVEDLEPPQSWTSTEDVEAWISKYVQSLLGKKIDVAGDLFQQGLDSLTATMLLRVVKSTLHSSSDPNVQSAATRINAQTIFGKPTVRQLAQLLVCFCGNGDEPVDPVAEAIQGMQTMIQKYDSNWSSQVAYGTRPVQKERVVVTGTTGGLGSYLLANLLADDRIEKVWAMNRKSSKGSTGERQTRSFEDKLLDTSLLKSDKLVLVDVDLEDIKLGLCDELYNGIRNGATIIVHNAWEVNFNLSLQSFEPSIRGVRNLLNLAFSSTSPAGLPRFAFTSSVAVAGSAGSGRYLKEVPVALEDAATSMGYGQSKLVAEKILESARRTGLQTCIIRLGQLTGDTKSGSWSTTDWVPSLIGSSVSVGCLPGATGVISWLPLDVAARSTIDICVARRDLPSVVHISHPRPIPWMDIMRAFSRSITPNFGSEVPIVRLDEWNERVLEAAASFKGPQDDIFKRLPSTKIQSMVSSMVQAENEPRSHGSESKSESCGGTQLDTTIAQKLSESLRATQELRVEHVQKWVGYWTSRGLFKNT